MDWTRVWLVYPLCSVQLAIKKLLEGNKENKYQIKSGEPNCKGVILLNISIGFCLD